jgi:hypothetical protein
VVDIISMHGMVENIKLLIRPCEVS